ncbi:hypothetical protein RDABS01_012440 [Bienertia sinuspersici]
MLFHGRFDGDRFNFLLLDLDKSSKADKVDHELIFPVDAMVKFKSDFTSFHRSLFVINECNGLILIVKQIRKPSCSVDHYGLGCCPVSHQFKVLRILTIGDSCKRMLEIQTLGTNEWRMIGDAPPCDKLDRSGVFLHGSLNKLCCKDNCIWSFNFENEQFLQLSTPDELQLQREVLKHMGVINSCLCITSSPKNRYEFWVMQEFGVNDSWVKVFVIAMENFFPPRLPLLKLATGEILFAGGHGLFLYLRLCDTEESGSWKMMNLFGDWYSRTIAPCSAKFSRINN